VTLDRWLLGAGAAVAVGTFGTFRAWRTTQENSILVDHDRLLVEILLWWLAWAVAIAFLRRSSLTVSAVVRDERAKRRRQGAPEATKDLLPLARERADEDGEAETGGERRGRAELGHKLLLVVQEQRLCLPTDDGGEGLLLLRVSVLDLVAEPDEELEVRPGRVLIVRPPLTHLASSHRFGCPSTFSSRRGLSLHQYR
jgi:hypothetical protein